MNYDMLKFWFDVLQFAGTILIGVYVWLSNRHRVTAERITKLEDDVDRRLDTHTDRLTALEVSAAAAPTHDDLKILHKRLTDMNGELQKLAGNSMQVSRTVELIHQHLLNGGH